jgi:glycerol uptake facilitator-like aquaporin
MLNRNLGKTTAVCYIIMQILGAIIGIMVAHAMFGQDLIQVSSKLRDGPALAFSEFIATFGLLITIFGAVRFKPEFTPVAVGLYITSAYWFTASTSFANPAVTIARALSDTFAGIAPSSVPFFIAAQLAGAIAALLLGNWLFNSHELKTRDA